MKQYSTISKSACTTSRIYHITRSNVLLVVFISLTTSAEAQDVVHNLDVQTRNFEKVTRKERNLCSSPKRHMLTLKSQKVSITKKNNSVPVFNADIEEKNSLTYEQMRIP